MKTRIACCALLFVFIAAAAPALAEEPELVKKAMVIQVTPGTIALPKGEAARIPVSGARVRSSDMRDLNREYNEIKDKVDDLNQKITLVTPDYTEVQNLKGDITGVKQRFGGIVTLAGAQIPWPIIMDELGRVMRDSVWIENFSYDGNGATWEFEGYALSTQEFQRFLVQMFDSQVFVGVALDSKDVESGGPESGGSDEWRPRSRRSVGGMRSMDGPPGAYADENADFPAPGPMIEEYGRDDLTPQPRYKLPSGPSQWRSIEDFFRGSMWYPELLWKFKMSGTLNQELIKVGGQVFGQEVVAFFSS